jgi:hypothetical protein
MTVDATSTDALPSVQASLNYLVPAPGKPARYTYEPPPGIPLTRFVSAQRVRGPDTLTSAPPRQSIELRAFVFYPD